MSDIYSAQDEIRPEVMRFAHAMEERLRRNDYKGGWKDCQPDYLIKRLCEEYLELRDAIREKGLWGPWVRGEAADVANFAMMVWDIAMIAEENQVRDSWKPIIAENGNPVKEEERMNQLFCETTEELFCEITENLELTQKNKELFRIFLHSLDTEEMRIFILNRLFVRRIAQNGEVRE